MRDHLFGGWEGSGHTFAGHKVNHGVSHSFAYKIEGFPVAIPMITLARRGFFPRPLEIACFNAAYIAFEFRIFLGIGEGKLGIH